MVGPLIQTWQYHHCEENDPRVTGASVMREEAGSPAELSIKGSNCAVVVQYCPWCGRELSKLAFDEPWPKRK